MTDLTPQAETIPFFSTVTGSRVAPVKRATRPLGTRHSATRPICSRPSMRWLISASMFGWSSVRIPRWSIPSRNVWPVGRPKPVVISSVRREREHESLLEAAMDLHRAGVALNFAAMTPSRRLLSLPAYAWDKSRWWHESPDWREGRLASGGRGLLDMRLPRATPTWTARLDSRHMAFLKDHKVESHVIFPAAAFVEMVLEAGVQLFEGRPFVVEDFEIRKPLILPDPASGVQLEISYEPNERTFTIQSRFDQGASWSLHVVGRCAASAPNRLCRVHAEIGKRSDPANLKPVEMEGFYRYMSDLGLRYGEEFRSVRELSAGHGESAGRVALSESIAARAGRISAASGAPRRRAASFSLPGAPRLKTAARS